MNVMSKIKPAPNETAVLKLMADGRERTVGDVMMRVGGDEIQVRQILKKLTDSGKLKTDTIARLTPKVTVWSKAKSMEKPQMTWAEMARAEGHMRGVPQPLPSGLPNGGTPGSVTMSRAARIAKVLAERGPMTRRQIEEAAGINEWQFNDAMQRCRVKFRIIAKHSRIAPTVYSLEAAE